MTAHEGHDPRHMSTETCDHGRLLWQSCRDCAAPACEEVPK